MMQLIVIIAVYSALVISTAYLVYKGRPIIAFALVMAYLIIGLCSAIYALY